MKVGNIFISGSCDYNCIFCNGSNLNKEEILKIEEEALKNLKYHVENGIDVIEISGNDPGEYEKILDLVRLIKKNGIKEIGLTTNGVKASSMLKELEGAGLNQLVFPLYGHNDEINKKTIKGDYTLNHVKKILSTPSSLYLVVKIGLTKYNYMHIKDMIDFVLKNTNTKNTTSIEVCRILPSGRYNDFFISLDKLRQPVNEAYDYIFELCKKQKTPNFVFDLENCLIDHYDPLFNINIPPNIGTQKYNNNYKTEMENFPKYRIRDKVKGCESCSCYGTNCSGMLRVEHNNYGDLTRPVKSFLS